MRRALGVPGTLKTGICGLAKISSIHTFLYSEFIKFQCGPKDLLFTWRKMLIRCPQSELFAKSELGDTPDLVNFDSFGPKRGSNVV